MDISLVYCIAEWRCFNFDIDHGYKWNLGHRSLYAISPCGCYTLKGNGIEMLL
jgi:hypothetical protein